MKRSLLFSWGLVLLSCVSPADGALVNRYTFNGGNVTDSVGGQNGTLVNPSGLAAYVGGQLDLSAANNGQASSTANPGGGLTGAYIDLPDGIASAAITGGVAGQATFEAWVTVSTNRAWARVFDFGASNSGEDVSDSASASDSIFMSPQVNFAPPLNGYGFGSIGGGVFTDAIVTTGANLPTGSQQHVVATYNLGDFTGGANGTVNLYLNGSLVKTGAISSGMLPLGLSGENNDWLGRSQYANDPLFDGAFNEFNIYNNALSAAQISANFTAGPVPAPGPTLIVDRATGGVSIRNTTGSAQSLLGYSVTSAAGGLNVSPAWDPIAPASGWTISTQTASQLTEGGATGVNLAANGGTTTLGTAWNRSNIEDLQFSYTLGAGGGSGLGAVQYTGNSGLPFARSDLNIDGSITSADWALFLAGNATNIGSLTQVQRYLKGDLNNDSVNDHADFLVFRGDYIAANGEAAFNALLAGVPEPASIVLAAGLFVGLARARRRIAAKRCWIAGATLATLAVGLAGDADAAVRNRYSFSGNTVTVGPNTFNVPDSVGTAHAKTAGGTATFAGGQLDASANAGEPSDMIVSDVYVDLPNGVISSAAGAGTSGALSLEWWVTASTGRVWQRIGDFGTANGGEDVSDGAFGENVFVTTNDGRGPNFGLTAYTGVGTGAGEFTKASGPNLGGVGNEIHVVAVFDHNDTAAGANPNGTMTLYLDGVSAGTDAIQPGLDLRTFVNDNNWLGRSQYADAVFDGKYNEFRIHDNALSAGQVSFNDIVGPNVVQAATDVFKVEVNKTTGQARFVNNLSVPVNINYYKIGSAAGALNLAGWNSFDDKESGDPFGVGWDESGGSDANELIEYVLPTAGSAIAANASVTLGSAYNPAVFGAANGDLTFEFGLPNGRVVPGLVTYVTGGLSGDYNNDLRVDGADLLVWQRTLGSNVTAGTGADGNANGVIDAGDLAVWKGNFGVGGATAAVAAAPEPGSGALAAILGVGLACGRARRRR